jgi:hypothetical protein
MRTRTFPFLFLSCILLGCDSSGPFSYVPASGKISYDDGAPLPSELTLVFIAQDAPEVKNLVPRAGIANVNASGVFDSVTSHKFGDGLIPGKHKVVIQLPRGQNAQPIVRQEYTSDETTPLIVDTADAPFDIKVPKP